MACAILQEAGVLTHSGVSMCRMKTFIAEIKLIRQFELSVRRPCRSAPTVTQEDRTEKGRFLCTIGHATLICSARFFHDPEQFKSKSFLLGEQRRSPCLPSSLSAGPLVRRAEESGEWAGSVDTSVWYTSVDAVEDLASPSTAGKRLYAWMEFPKSILADAGQVFVASRADGRAESSCRYVFFGRIVAAVDHTPGPAPADRKPPALLSSDLRIARPRAKFGVVSQLRNDHEAIGAGMFASSAHVLAYSGFELVHVSSGCHAVIGRPFGEKGKFSFTWKDGGRKGLQKGDALELHYCVNVAESRSANVRSFFQM
eukprot:Polyplicarium_translucidae@DN2744_c0_g1_i2.p1